jgi:predicted RNase H-like nuclease
MLEWREDGLSEVEPTQLVHTDEEICRAIAEQDVGNTLVIAVDAPLVVPNLAGERPVEGEMRRRFARYHAACHPANRRLLGEPPRGERLCAMLAERLNVQVAPAPPVRQACRVAFEVYPHAAMVRLFRLPRILEYKARSGRGLAYRREQMQRYVGLLRQLPVPKLGLPDWLSEVPETPAGLKRFEDRLDALFCAWLAARAWWYGGEVLGEAHTGTIWLPAQEYELPTQNIETQP